MLSLILAANLLGAEPAGLPSCAVELIVLGTAQDGGIPQTGSWSDPAWEVESERARVVSLGLVDHRSGARYLFEATPDFREQLYQLTQAAGARETGTPLDGVFITHAHIGHYTGLMFLGHESMGARRVPVHVLPRMAEFLSTNGPWSQLVAYQNIMLEVMEPGEPVALAPDLSVTALRVPHREEYSEVAGFRIQGPAGGALFIPDIDSWEDWDGAGVRLEDEMARVEHAYLDATFYADGELGGRDMSAIPHPRVTGTMDRLADEPEAVRAKVRFIHVNHTNPLRYRQSPASRDVEARGFNVAREGERICLSDE